MSFRIGIHGVRKVHGCAHGEQGGRTCCHEVERGTLVRRAVDDRHDHFMGWHVGSKKLNGPSVHFKDIGNHTDSNVMEISSHRAAQHASPIGRWRLHRGAQLRNDGAHCCAAEMFIRNRGFLHVPHAADLVQRWRDDALIDSKERHSAAQCLDGNACGRFLVAL